MPVGKRALRVGIDQGRLVADGQPVGGEAPRQGRFSGTAFRGGKGDDAEHAGPSKVAISRKPKLYNFDVQQHSAQKRSVISLPLALWQGCTSKQVQGNSF